MGDVFKALSDSTRRAILQLLKDQDVAAGDIARQFSISKPAISKHLDILKNADLISCEKHGQFVMYSLNTTALQHVVGGFLNFFDSVQSENSYEKQSH